MIKIIFAGGGTGGHIVPIIAVAREIRKIKPKEDIKFFFIGPKDEFSDILISQEGIKVKHILAGKIRRYLSFKSFFQNIADILFKNPFGFIQAFFQIFFINPDLIFSKGGFGSIPTAIAGRILGVPIFLHESDVTPGLANRFLNRFTSEVFVSFPKTEYFPFKKMILTGNPIRKELIGELKEEAKKSLKINSQKPVILILGGSQGAQRVNDRILEILPELLNNFEIIMQCGEKNFDQVRSEAKATINNEELYKSFHLFPFMKEPELKQVYSAADLIVSRAGSGSIFEIAAANLPSILIPLPESAQNHQVKNAYAYAENGASIVIEESNFTPRFFLEKLKYLFSQPAELDKMSAKAKSFSKPEAAKVIANYLIEYITT